MVSVLGSPLERTFENGKHVASARVRGWLRFLPAGFLALWLCGWAAGEAFGVVALAGILLRTLAPGAQLPIPLPAMEGAGPGAWLVIAFLLVWLTFWTVGGIAAIAALLELLTLRERLSFDAGGVRSERCVLGWSAVREWDAGAIETFAMRRRGGALEIRSRGRTEVLLTLGTAAERQTLREELRGLFARGAARAAETRELPEDWESFPDPEGGGTVLVRKGWRGFGARELVLGSGTVTFRRRFGGRHWCDTLRPTSLGLTRSLDSDGDEHFRLEIREGPRRRVVHQAMNELDSVQRLGSWLAAQIGRTLEVARDIEPG